MAKAEVEAVPVRFMSESPTGIGAVVLEVAGVNLARYTRSITITSEVGKMATVELNIAAREGLDITLPACVTVNVLPAVEGWVDVTAYGDGGLQHEVRIRAVVNGEK